MELFFLFVLIALMAAALGSGFPVAFALPGSAIVTIGLAAGTGMLFAGDSAAFFSHGGPAQWLNAGVTNFRGIYWEAERDTLIAIPLFVFMGIMLQRSKIAEDLLVTMAQLFGPIPGGLGISVVFVGALLAATTGIVGATVVAMGLISLPAMLRNKYSTPLATGTIAASGTLGQIIPPSIVLIILADQLASASDQAGTARAALYRESTGELSMPSTFAVSSTSAGEMFLGAFLPGLVLVGLYMAFILTVSLVRPSLAPPVQREGALDSRFLGKVLLSLVPPLALIFMVLGSIIGGIATVNQAGAIGAVGAMLMAGYRLREGQPRAFAPAALAVLALLGLAIVISFHDVNVKRIDTTEDALGVLMAAITVSMLLFAICWSGWRTLIIDDTLRGVMVETAKTTALVFIILLGAAMLTSAFRAFGGEEIVKDFLQGLPGGFWTQLVIVMLVIFLLGFFLDFIEIAVVVVPIVAPILLADPGANVTAVWLGVMIGLNIQTSFLTPPFGFALFYLRGVAPAVVKTIQIYKGVIPFIALQLLALVIVGAYPPLVNYLPNRVSLLSETAPPPQNPQLQVCIERYVNARMLGDRAAIQGAIDTAQTLPVDYLPADLGQRLTASFDQAGQAFALMQAVQDANATLEAAKPAYRPLHTQVRELERDARRYENQIKDLRTIVARSGPGGIYSAAQGQAARAEIAELTASRDALLAQIPADWKPRHDAFSVLVRAEVNARRTYRRAVDAAYAPVRETREMVAAADALAALEGPLRDLPAALSSQSPEDFVAVLDPLRRDLNTVAGASEIRGALTEARRAMRARTPDIARAGAGLTQAVALMESELTWRRQAARDLIPALETYDAAIRDTIGLRGQPRLPREQALYVASCKADHRDLSLSF